MEEYRFRVKLDVFLGCEAV